MSDQPNSSAAPGSEIAVLSGLMRGYEEAAELADRERLTAEHFNSRVHAKLYRAIRLAGDVFGIEPSVQAIADSIKDLPEVSGDAVEFITDLVAGGDGSYNAGFHARKVIEAAQKRQLVGLGHELGDAARNGHPVEDILDLCRDRVEAIETQSAGAAAGLVSGAELLGERVEGFLPPAFGSSIYALDQQLAGGFRAGFNPVAGRPGRGKTTLANQVAAHAAQIEIPVLFVSLEDSVQRQVGVMVSRLAFVDSREIGIDRFTGDEDRSIDQKRRAVHEAYRTYQKKIDPHLRFCTEASLSRLRQILTTWSRTHREAPYRLVIIDTAHNIHVPGDSGVERADAVAGGLKRIQIENGLTMFLTVHMSRAGEIRNSTEFEFLADLRLRLVAEDPEHPDTDDRNLDAFCRKHPIVPVKLLIEKDKVAGQTGSADLVFNKKLGLFAGRERE